VVGSGRVGNNCAGFGCLRGLWPQGLARTRAPIGLCAGGISVSTSYVWSWGSSSYASAQPQSPGAVSPRGAVPLPFSGQNPYTRASRTSNGDPSGKDLGSRNGIRLPGRETVPRDLNRRAVIKVGRHLFCQSGGSVRRRKPELSTLAADCSCRRRAKLANG